MVRSGSFGFGVSACAEVVWTGKGKCEGVRESLVRSGTTTWRECKGTLEGRLAGRCACGDGDDGVYVCVYKCVCVCARARVRVGGGGGSECVCVWGGGWG